MVESRGSTHAALHAYLEGKIVEHLHLDFSNQGSTVVAQIRSPARDSRVSSGTLQEIYGLSSMYSGRGSLWSKLCFWLMKDANEEKRRFLGLRASSYQPLRPGSMIQISPWAISHAKTRKLQTESRLQRTRLHRRPGLYRKMN